MFFTIYVVSKGVKSGLEKAVKLDPKDAATWIKLARYEKDAKKAIILLKKGLTKKSTESSRISVV